MRGLSVCLLNSRHVCFSKCCMCTLKQPRICAIKKEKDKGEGRMCTWGVKSRWRGGVAHHCFCQQVVIRVRVVGSEEGVS